MLKFAAASKLMQHPVFRARHAVPGGIGGSSPGTVFALVCALGIAAFYGWTVWSTGADLSFKGQRTDYYNLLVDGFQEGQLHMKVEVDPALLALPPEQRPGNAPFLLDASLYQGRYYLYFGVAPAVLLYWPVTALTGQDMPEAVAVLVFALLALSLGWAWWREMRCVLLPQLGVKWDWLAVLAFGLCTGAPSALRRPMFYEVAAFAGWAFGILMLWALVRAWRSERHAGRWLLLAGVACGLAVGSRANLAPAGLLALTAGALLVGGRLAVGPVSRLRGAMLALLLTGGGAGVVGVGLAGYNYARFGDPLEFGHSHQIGLNPKRFFQGVNLVHNLGLYYAKPPTLNAYFPYVLPPEESPKPADYIGRESVHGEWIWNLALIGGLAGYWLHGRRKEVSVGLLLAGPVAIWFAGNLLVTGLTGVRANRYMLDFHPALVGLTVLGIGFLAAGLQGSKRWVVRGLASWVLVAGVFNVLASIQVHGFFAETNPGLFRRIARAADDIVFAFMPFIGRSVGDQEVVLRWPTDARGGRRPFVSVAANGFDDGLWLETDGGARARFIYQHGDYGTVDGPWFDVTTGATARIRVSGAFLLPPTHHAWYGTRATVIRAALKHRLRITVDGIPRFDRDVPSFDSAPWLLRWGAWRLGDGVLRRDAAMPARGRRLELDEDWIACLAQRRGAVHLQVRLPSDRFGSAEPLVQTGVFPRLDLLQTRFTRPGHVQLVHDSLGGGATVSDEFAVDYSQAHAVEVELPAAHDPVAWNEHDTLVNNSVERLRVRWNGREVFSSPTLPHPAMGGSLVVGANPNQLSGVRMAYAAEVTTAPGLTRLPSAGGWEHRFAPRDFLTGTKGTLMAWQRADGRKAAIVWRRREPAGPVQLGWLDEGQVAWTTDTLTDSSGLVRVALQRETAQNAPGENGWFTLIQEGRTIIRASTDFFDAGPATGLAIEGCRWIACVPAPEPTTGLEPAMLPGRIRIRLALPQEGLDRSVPLLTAGRTGAADSLFMRPSGGGRYVFGLDHWGVAAIEGMPVAVVPGKSATLVVELSSLLPDEAPPAGWVKVWLDGALVLEARLALHPVKAGEIEIGRNSLGMSTSGPVFTGEIFSVQRRAAAP